MRSDAYFMYVSDEQRRIWLKLTRPLKGNSKMADFFVAPPQCGLNHTFVVSPNKSSHFWASQVDDSLSSAPLRFHYLKSQVTLTCLLATLGVRPMISDKTYPTFISFLGSSSDKITIGVAFLECLYFKNKKLRESCGLKRSHEALGKTLSRRGPILSQSFFQKNSEAGCRSRTWLLRH